MGGALRFLCTGQKLLCGDYLIFSFIGVMSAFLQEDSGTVSVREFGYTNYCCATFS